MKTTTAYNLKLHLETEHEKEVDLDTIKGYNKPIKNTKKSKNRRFQFWNYFNYSLCIFSPNPYGEADKRCPTKAERERIHLCVLRPNHQ